MADASAPASDVGLGPPRPSTPSAAGTMSAGHVDPLASACTTLQAQSHLFLSPELSACFSKLHGVRGHEKWARASPPPLGPEVAWKDAHSADALGVHGPRATRP